MGKFSNFIKSIKLRRYERTFRNDENYEAFKGIIKSSYSKIIEDARNGEGYAVYADFDSDVAKKAMAIREAMDNGLDYELLLNPKFNVHQMDEIITGLQNGLTSEQVKRYANPSYNAGQMEQLRIATENNLTDEQINFFKSSDFSAGQMREIRTAIENNLPETYIKQIAKPEIHYAAMAEMRKAMGDNTNKPAEIKKLCRKLSFCSTNIMRNGLELGISPDTIDGIIEKMSELNDYWDKKSLRALSREICEEISDGKVTDLDHYFADKFAEPEPELPPGDDEESNNKSAAEIAENAPESELEPESESVGEINIESLDSQIKKDTEQFPPELQEAVPTEQNTPAAEKEETVPDVEVNF